MNVVRSDGKAPARHQRYGGKRQTKVSRQAVTLPMSVHVPTTPDHNPEEG